LANYREEVPNQVAQQLERGKVTLIDVRNLSEWDEEHIPGAQHIMLGYLGERAVEIQADRPVVVQCRIGIRSSIGVSILKAKGFENVINLQGGIEGWQSADLPIVQA
jgi:hydroxyacylglutathione hydrolase